MKCPRSKFKNGKVLKILAFTTFSLLCSCSSTLNVKLEYEVAKAEISQYFEERVLAGEKPVENEALKKISPFYRPKFSENDSGTKGVWVLNLGSRYSKAQALLPKMLTLELKKKGEYSKIYIDVKKHGLFFSERLRNDERSWINFMHRLLNERE